MHWITPVHTPAAGHAQDHRAGEDNVLSRNS